VNKRKNKNLWLQTREDKLNRFRKKIFTAEQPKKKHLNKLELIEHWIMFGNQGQAVMLQNTTKGKKQEKENRRDALQERYQVMTSNLGIGENSNVPASFCGAKAHGGAVEQGGMMGIYEPQLGIRFMFEGGLGGVGGCTSSCSMEQFLVVAWAEVGGCMASHS
jgi:hypothetical protein